MRKLRAFLPALLAAGLLASVLPATASASDYGQCDPGDFCMYHDFARGGGIYHWEGNDSNLHNDAFEAAHTWIAVGNSTKSARNAGVGPVTGYVDVLVYTEENYQGAAACVKQDYYGDFREPYINNIESYKWVKRTTCNLYRSALL